MLLRLCTSDSLRSRYDIPKLISDFVMSNAPTLSVNCDSILFGGTVDHKQQYVKNQILLIKSITIQSSTSTSQIIDDGVLVPPILAPDLILYPYQ